MAAQQGNEGLLNPDVLISEFQRGQLMEQRRRHLVSAVTSEQDAIIEGTRLEWVGARTFYDADPNTIDSEQATHVLGMMAEQRRIKRDLTGLQSNLSKLAVNAAVTIVSLHSDSNAIRLMEFVGAPISGGPRDTITKTGLPKASGTVKSLDVAANELRLAPRRYDPRRGNYGTYIISLLDAVGQPAVDVQVRQKGWTDVTGPTVPQRLIGSFARFIGAGRAVER